MILAAYIEIMTAATAASVKRVASDLQERGFAVDSEDWPTTATDGPTDLAGVDAPLQVVIPRDSTPLSVISAVANAAHEGRVPVVVTDRYDRDQVHDILSSPFALADQQDGLRRFHPVEDRIQLTDDTFACVAAEGALSWFEVAEGESADSPQLHLTAGGETVAVLDSVDGLACPGPSPAAFRHRYARRDDGRFAVYEGAALVGTYRGVTAMRADGVRPVPLPLVPEHHVRSNGHLARATVLATVEDGAVRYEDCR